LKEECNTNTVVPLASIAIWLLMVDMYEADKLCNLSFIIMVVKVLKHEIE